jgi:hypothetical protein
MYIDDSGDIGTLLGLESKLVLKGTEGRLVIIPEPDLSVADLPKIHVRKGWHVHVKIDPEHVAGKQVYHIDQEIGHLKAYGDLKHQLFLAYLHALTSTCVADPLTNCTGTERAISILKSGALQSFTKLTAEDIQLYKLVARLAAGRSSYPITDKSMQIVTWDDDLSFLSQCEDFYLIVKDMFRKATEQQVLECEPTVSIPDISQDREEHLLLRARLRSSYLRVSGFGAENFSTDFDTIYEARDRRTPSDNAKSAFRIAKVILENRTEPCMRTETFKMDLMSLFKTIGTIDGGHNILKGSDLRYSANLFQEADARIAQNWCSLMNLFSDSEKRPNRTSLMFWLCTVTYAVNQKHHHRIAQALAWAFNNPDVIRLSATLPQKLTIHDGTNLDWHSVHDIIRRHGKIADSTSYVGGQRTSARLEGSLAAAFAGYHSRAVWILLRNA